MSCLRDSALWKSFRGLSRILSMNWSLSWGRVAWVLRIESRNWEINSLWGGGGREGGREKSSTRLQVQAPNTDCLTQQVS